MSAGQIPERGDLVWLEFTPQSGSERAGAPPALVITPKSCNPKVGLALFCRITSKTKGYPFEGPRPTDGQVVGVMLADQIQSLDWRAKNTRLIERATPDVIALVMARLGSLLVRPPFPPQSPR